MEDIQGRFLRPKTAQNGKQSSPSKKGKSEKEAKASKAGKSSERTPKASKAGFVQPQISTSDPKSSPSEVEMRNMFASQGNARALLEALDNGLIPQSVMEVMDQGTPCEMVPGDVEITSELLVPENQNLLSVTGTFRPEGCRSTMSSSTCMVSTD